jgi:8-amino-7-oxononanoate synthase
VLPEAIEPITATQVRWRGKILNYFAGCDYLGLSHEPELVHAIQKGAGEHGINAAASRKTTGNRPIYGRTEIQIARYFGAKKAVLVSNGYLTNLTVAQATTGTFKTAIIDERSHASLQDALTLLGAKVIRFKHLDPADLQSRISAEIRNEQTVLITDGMFAHSGEIAPLKKYRRLLGPKVWLWVDDSHAGGVLGERGGGSVELSGISRMNVIQTVTFSKGFGCYGGAILCSGKLAENIFARSRIVSGNTPIPPMLAAGILRALKLANSKRRKMLFANIILFCELLGRSTSRIMGPIFPFHPGSGEEADRLRNELLTAGTYPPFIQYPGGPKDGYFRFAFSAKHSKTQITQLAQVIRRFLR